MSHILKQKKVEVKNKIIKNWDLVINLMDWKVI